MKQFIKDVIIFILPIIFSIGFLYLYLNFAIKTTTINLILPLTINKIAVGDSHIEQSINDSILVNTKNIACNSESFIYSFYKIATVTKNNPQIDTIFLGASYHSFSKYYDDFIYNNSVLIKYFYILPLNIQYEILNKTKKPFNIFIHSLKLALIPNKYSDWIGAFSNYATNATINNNSIVDRINFQYYKDNELYGFSDENIFYFNKIVKFCNENDIELIIINTPLHKNYKEKIPKEFIEKFNSIIAQNKLDIIEFDKFIFADNDFLPDGDHVSKNGSVKTSIIIDSLLKNQ